MFYESVYQLHLYISKNHNLKKILGIVALGILINV